MSESKPGARPSQVTMAGWMAVVASGLLVLTLFDAMAQIRSLEVRESVSEFLANPPGSGLGLEVPEVVEILRVLTLFSGAAAAAALVLAIYVLQRNNGARIGFTVAAAVIMLTSPVAGGFLPVVIAFAALMLWTRPARDWFAGRAPAQADQKGRLVTSSSEHPPPSEDRPGDRPAGSSQWPPRMPEGGDRPTPPPSQGWPAAPGQGWPAPPQGQQQPQNPPPYGPYGQQPPSPYGQQQYGAPQHQPYGGYPSYPPQGGPDRRPTTVTVAAWLTWIFAGLTGLLYLLLVLLLLTARDQFLDALRQEPQLQQLDMSTNDLMALLWVMSAIFLFWCVAALGLGVLAFRRVNWARITLAVSAGISALLSIAAFPFGLLHLLAAGATVVLLFVGGANQWYARRSGPQYYPSQYGQPQYGQQPYGQEPHGDQQPYGQGPHGDQQRGDQPHGQAPPSERPEQPRHGEQEPPKNVW